MTHSDRSAEELSLIFGRLLSCESTMRTPRLLLENAGAVLGGPPTGRAPGTGRDGKMLPSELLKKIAGGGADAAPRAGARTDPPVV
jgi:hypothetical protein